LGSLQLARLVEIADTLYPFDLAEPWDNVGIQIGHPDRIIERIAFSLDPSPCALEFAAQNQCGLLVTHHPILLSPIIRLVAHEYPSRLLMLAAKKEVDVVSLHTNLDAAVGGLNDHLTHIMKLEGVQTPDHARCARIGALANPVGLHSLAVHLGRLFEASSVRVIARDDRVVERVFCASGSGMGYLGEALRLGADVMVTGDVRYHAAIEALQLGMAVIDCGHFPLEKAAPQIMARAFSKALHELDARVECIVYDEEQDPFAKGYIGEEDLS